jgi:hypothetical protein|uniref:DUF4408 domain-containing protein n=1 Tax=Fagus sylvatica TaxID=28930 RepID=A0A2N9GT34_FAGSY
MAKPPPPNLVEDSIKPNKSSKEYPQKANGMSFYAFLFSIFIYISILYIFNLSPSTLFNTTKFWFFLSNTLILIIAVDYGAYSSSKEKQDFYQEYVMDTQVKNVPSFVSQHPETIKEVVEVLQEPEKEKIQAKPYRRSKSEKTKRVLIDESKNIVLRMSETAKHERTPSLEENEFSSMSDEELNRRVEEFIQRFNRQIRLQARNFTQVSNE